MAQKWLEGALKWPRGSLVASESTRDGVGGWTNQELKGGNCTWIVEPPGPQASAQESRRAWRVHPSASQGISSPLDTKCRPCIELGYALLDHRRNKNQTFEAVLGASRPLDRKGNAHLKPGLLEGETSYHGVIRSMRVASKSFRGKGKVSRGCMRARKVEGGALRSNQGCEACSKLTVGEGNEPWYSQNDLLSVNMKVDPLSSYEVTQKVMKGSLKLDEGWWETTKEQLGLMAHLQDIALYHDQEQDSELLKVGVELLKVLEDVLGWLDLRVLEGYESFEAVPLLKDWGIDYKEVPELSRTGYLLSPGPYHTLIPPRDNLAGPAPALRTPVLGWRRSPNVGNQSQKGKMKCWGHLDASSSVKRAQKVSGGLKGSGISKWLMGSQRGFLLTLRQWGKGSYDLEQLENVRGGARELGCGRRGRTAGWSRGVGRMWKYEIMHTQSQDIHKTVQYGLSAQKV
ncbi:hypothetical protein EDD16DRAFT_1521107 [Pisolithus croceorrhizus]|nr:hypothetical protein EDD16DRAFT_1521107 [Pisolithus croceorrhizus]